VNALILIRQAVVHLFAPGVILLPRRIGSGGSGSGQGHRDGGSTQELFCKIVHLIILRSW